MCFCGHIHLFETKILYAEHYEQYYDYFYYYYVVAIQFAILFFSMTNFKTQIETLDCNSLNYNH